MNPVQGITMGRVVMSLIRSAINSAAWSAAREVVRPALNFAWNSTSRPRHAIATKAKALVTRKKKENVPKDNGVVRTPGNTQKTVPANKTVGVKGYHVSSPRNKTSRGCKRLKADRYRANNISSI